MEPTRDYRDDYTLIDIKTLLKEYEDLFPQSSIAFKGIKGDLGEMNIQLKLDAKIIKH